LPSTVTDSHSETSPGCFVLACDSRFTVGSAVTALSAAISSTSKEKPLDFHVLDCDQTRNAFTRLELWLAPFAHLVKLHRVSVPENTLEHLRPKLRGSLTTYARLLIPNLIDSDDVVYLDSDLLVLKDLNEFPKAIKRDTLLTAILDPGYLCLGNDQPLGLNADSSHSEKWKSLPYFNAGVLRFSPKQWKHKRIGEQALELIRNTNCQAWDQTALNHTLAGETGDISFIDSSWNFPRQLWREGPATTDPAIYHFIGASKPWIKFHPEPGYQLWHAFLETFFYNVHPNLEEEQKRIRSIRRNAIQRIAVAPIMTTLHMIRARIAPPKELRKRSLEAVQFWKHIWKNGKTVLYPSPVIKKWIVRWQESTSQDISTPSKDP